MDRIQDIRLFIRIVDLGSFSKAAQELGIGQPAATKQINRMEAQLGARLLHRTTHGVSATEIGLLYYEKCKLICLHADEASSVGTLLQTQAEGSMRISSSVAFGRRVMAPLVLRYMREQPMLQIDLSFDDRYVNLVEQGVDLAVRMGRLADSTLGASYLGTNPWMLGAAPAYLARRGRPHSPGELAAHDCLIYSSVQGDARWLFHGASGEDESVPVKGPLRSNNLSAVLAACEAGFGLAVLPWYVARDSVAAGRVVPLLEGHALPSQEMHAVFPSPKLVPQKVKSFIAWLQAQLQDGWWQRAP